MKLCCSYKTGTTVGGVLGLLQSSIGLGLNLFFLLFYFEVIPSEGWAWHTLEKALPEEWMTYKALTITACASNALWLLTSLLLIIGHFKRNCNMMQSWVIVTSLVLLYDVVAFIIFLAKTGDMEKVKNEEHKDYTFYILEVFSLGRLSLITIVLNAFLCYCVQKRIFEILKENRKEEESSSGSGSLTSPNGIGVYFPTDDDEHKDTRSESDPRYRLPNGKSSPLYGIDHKGFKNEPFTKPQNGIPPRDNEEPVDDRLASFEEHSDRTRGEEERRAKLVSQLHKKLSVDDDRGRYQYPIEIPRVPAPVPKEGNYPYPNETIKDQRPRPDSPMIQPRRQVFVATPFVPNIDYNKQNSIPEVERSAYDNPALDLSYDLPPPQAHPVPGRPIDQGYNRRPSDPRRYMRDNSRGPEPVTSTPNVARLAAIVERENSFRSQNGPPYVIRRQNSNRSYQDDRPRAPVYNPNSRQARALPQPRRLDGYVSEEDERYYRERANNHHHNNNNTRNYDSDAEYDYQRRGQGYPNGRNRY